VDYFEALNRIHNKTSNLEVVNSFDNVSVVVSSAITSYSNLYMTKIKLLILSLGGEVYYTDTDSIVTNIKLPQECLGKELGEFKEEYKVLRGYFISAKLYCLVYLDKQGNERVKVKSKGVENSKFTEKDFIKLLRNVNIKAVKNESKKSYTEGFVTIGVNNDITINADSYKKRIKIYNSKGV